MLNLIKKKKSFAATAILAVAAGLLSVPSALAASQADTLTMSSNSTSTTVGNTVTINVTQTFIAQSASDTLTATISLVSSPAGSVQVPSVTSLGVGNTNTVPSVTGFVSTSGALAAGLVTGVTTVSITPSHAGVYVVRATPAVVSGGGTLQAVPQNWTINVAAVPAVTAGNSTVTLNANQGVSTGADTPVTASMVANSTPGAQVATIVTVSKNNVPTDLSASTTLTATITGPGTLGFGGNTGTNNVSVAALPMSGRAITGLVGQNLIGVFSDGTAGTATITISAGTTVLATKTVTFAGAATTYLATSMIPNLQIGANGVDGSSTNYAVAVKVTDAASNLVANGTTVWATSSAPSVATVTASATTVGGYVYFAVQGLTTGSANIVFGSTQTSPAVTTSQAVKVTSSVASSVTLTFDKANYAPGEKMVLTLTAKDSSNEGVADTTLYTNFLAASATSSVALQGTLPTVTPVFKAGVATYTLYAPLTAGTFHVLATTGTTANLATPVKSLQLDAMASVVQDTSTTDALKAQITALLAQITANNLSNETAQAALKAQLDAVMAQNTAQAAANAAQVTANAAQLAVIQALNTTITKLNLKLNPPLKTLVCVKGTTVKKVKAVKPVCPTGYKVKK